MTIRIVTDSTCDLPEQIIQDNQIVVIPVGIHIGTREYLDGIDLSRQDFYERLPALTPAPTTSTPGPGVFFRLYQQLAEEGATEILSIHISAELSAITRIALQAAQETSAPSVTVFDSRQLSLGTGFLALTAAQAAAQGCSMRDILAILEEQITRTHVCAVVDTLEYLRRSGRMNFALSTIGALLQIKPILKMYAGRSSTERARTRWGAYKRLVSLLNEFGPYERLAILHANALDQAHTLLEEARHLLPSGNVWIGALNPVLGVHLGPGVVGFAGISK